MIRRIERVLTAASDALDRVCAVLAVFALFVMLASIMLQILARYVFAAPPAWTEELGRYAMIWAAMPGASMAYYRRADPVLLPRDMNGRPRRALALQLVETSAVLMLCAPVLWYAPGFLARHSHRITETLELNSALVVAIVPLSLLIIVIHSSARVAAAIRAVGESP